jgi:flagellar basal-body rod protein FlgC
MNLAKTMSLSAAGMRAQSERMRVIAENLANANSLAVTEGDDPYRRKVVSFKNELDRNLGANLVSVNKVVEDQSDFGMRYDPAHPAANQDGYVTMPNVNALVEMMDMKEAQRSYEANLKVIENAKSMLLQTIQILRS